MTTTLRRCSLCEKLVEVNVPQSNSQFAWIADLDVLCDECQVKHDAEVKAKEEAERRAQLLSLYNSEIAMGRISPDARHCSFKSSNPEIEQAFSDAWECAKSWDMKHQNLYIYGSTGTGKTFLARCLLNKMFSLEYSVTEATARHIVKVGRTWNEGNGEFENFKRCDLLIVDDIDKIPRPDETNLSTLWELFDARQGKYKRTIVTSNLDVRALMAVWNQGVPTNASLVRATLERLKPVHTIKMIGKSQRS